MIPNPTVASPHAQPTPVEEVPAGEAAAIERMIKELERQLRVRYLQKSKLVRRDAHPKILGLVRAQLTVSPECPVELRHGVFSTPSETFAAVIRYSNGDPNITHDLAPDVRGMAVKLTEVPGEFIEEEAGQDFVLATAEAFFGSDAVDYANFPRAATSSLATTGYFLRRWRAALRFGQSLTIPRSPLGIGYFSQTPYRLGPNCVKYHARPIVPRPIAGDPVYMLPIVRHVLGFAARMAPRLMSRVIRADAVRFALMRDLASGPVTFELLCQRWPDLGNLPTWAIEDATRTWLAPWVRVATIEIFQQCHIADRDAVAERMTFNPWHARKVHQPLGSINRARGAIYRTMSLFRNSHNPGSTIGSPHAIVCPSCHDDRRTRASDPSQ